MSTHRDECPEELIECPNKCRTWFNVRKLKRKDLPNHLSNKCYLRRHKCEHCGFEDTYEEITGIRDFWREKKCHYDTCHEYPLLCLNMCGPEAIKRKDMSIHRDTCPNERVKCPNKCIRYKDLKRKDLPYHLRIECYLRRYKCEHCEYEDTYEEITGIRDGKRRGTKCHYDTCPEYPLACPNKCGAKAIKRNDMSTHRDTCPLEPMECPFEADGCMTRVVRKDFDNHMSTQMLHHMLLMKTKHDCDMQEMKMKHGEDMKKQEQLLKGISINVDTLLQTCTEDQMLPLQSIRALIDKSHQLNKDDTLTIEIPNLSQYKRSKKAWCSPPFYVKEGYKMCLVVYPNGTGKGEGTHVSLSLVLVKGEFDDQLEWPIRCDSEHCLENIEVEVMSQQRKTYSYAMFPIDGIDRVHDGEVTKTIDMFLKHETSDEQEMVRGALAEIRFEIKYLDAMEVD